MYTIFWLVWLITSEWYQLVWKNQCRPTIRIEQMTRSEWVFQEETMAVEIPDRQKSRLISAERMSIIYYWSNDGRFEIWNAGFQSENKPSPICRGWWEVNANSLKMQFSEGNHLTFSIKSLSDCKLELEGEFRDENSPPLTLHQTFFRKGLPCQNRLSQK